MISNYLYPTLLQDPVKLELAVHINSTFLVHGFTTTGGKVHVVLFLEFTEKGGISHQRIRADGVVTKILPVVLTGLSVLMGTGASSSANTLRIS